MPAVELLPLNLPLHSGRGPQELGEKALVLWGSHSEWASSSFRSEHERHSQQHAGSHSTEAGLASKDRLLHPSPGSRPRVRVHELTPRQGLTKSHRRLHSTVHSENNISYRQCTDLNPILATTEGAGANACTVSFPQATQNTALQPRSFL